MDIQLNRLSNVVRELEHAVGAIRSATRWSGRGDSGGGRVTGRSDYQRRVDPANDEVLRDIFQANVDLYRRLTDTDDKGDAEQA